MAQGGSAGPSAGERWHVMAGWPYAAGLPTVSQTRGHVLCDVLARHARARGADVLFALGCDGFGLPVQVAARAAGQPFPEFVAAARRRHRERADLLGLSADPARGASTSDPEVYARTQAMFLLALEHGVAVRQPALVNECPRCTAVRANKETVGGRCAVCGTPVIAAVRDQWYFRMDPLVADVVRAAEDQHWPTAAARMLRAWHGARVGTLVRLDVSGTEPLDAFLADDTSLGYGEAVVVPPDHPRLRELAALGDTAAPERYLARAAAVPPATRRHDEAADGEWLGIHATVPETGAVLPLYVGRLAPGSGGPAVVTVPADDATHARFARARGLAPRGVAAPEATPGDRRALTHRVEDWLVSRQRSWGAPVPVVHCATCGVVPVPRAALPVLLPDPVPADGGLNRVPEFVATTCPRCGTAARRDTDVIDCNVDLWWHYLYPAKESDDWLPVDIACYGAEYAALTPFYLAGIALLRLAGRTRAPSAFSSLLLHGGVTGDEGLDLEAIVAKHGPDSIRLWLAGCVRPDRPLRWSTEAVGRATRTVRRAAAAADLPPGEPSEPWASRAEATEAEVLAHLDGRRTHLAAGAATALLDSATVAGDAKGALHAAQVAARLLAPFCPSIVRDPALVSSPA